MTTHQMSEFLSPSSLPNCLTRSSLGHTRRIRNKPEYNSQRLLNDPGTQTFCAPLPSFQQFAQLRSSAGFYSSNIFTVLKKSPQKDLACSRTSSRRPPASSTCARSTSPTTAPPGLTGRNQFCYKELTNVSGVIMSVQQGDSSLSMLAWQAILWEGRKAAQLELQL